MGHDEFHVLFYLSLNSGILIWTFLCLAESPVPAELLSSDATFSPSSLAHVLLQQASGSLPKLLQQKIRLIA
jgi:hypothetical protein